MSLAVLILPSYPGKTKLGTLQLQPLTRFAMKLSWHLFK